MEADLANYLAEGKVAAARQGLKAAVCLLATFRQAQSTSSIANLSFWYTTTRINDAQDTVYVVVGADISALFPSIVPQVIVEETGTGQVRSFSR